MSYILISCDVTLSVRLCTENYCEISVILITKVICIKSVQNGPNEICYVAVCNNYAICNKLQTALNCNAVCNTLQTAFRVLKNPDKTQMK